MDDIGDQLRARLEGGGDSEERRSAREGDGGARGWQLEAARAQVWLLQECLSSLVRGQLLQRLGLNLHPLQIAGKVPSQEDVE